MGDPGREYEEAKSAYLAALERLAKAKAALPKDGPLMKSDLMREAAIERDMRIAESYRGGVTNARQLAELHGVSVSVVRTAPRHWHGYGLRAADDCHTVLPLPGRDLNAGSLLTLRLFTDAPGLVRNAPSVRGGVLRSVRAGGGAPGTRLPVMAASGGTRAMVRSPR
jgi:hypothetical protein